ncbi:hypothetical protein [Cellulosilyticum lentocellum]|uniref:Uncharacterized protein n=1 Tax=Cellulosilyticum lentocellum (strain ATCC 49066 / DSM 5427 / NCIMB 11756 / RHM5) TaxID=642492 RepID=F2JSS2_CELLD|nr:hypothetical protein [Cellulosilyticum lentocellum]ADZ82906.1 hypothetical protein Clole_1177 [Cellulosilyticum lentocellum DSM 5427]
MQKITINSLYDDLAKETDVELKETIKDIIEWTETQYKKGSEIYWDDDWKDYVAFKDSEFVDSYAGMVTQQDYLYEELAKIMKGDK